MLSLIHIYSFTDEEYAIAVKKGNTELLDKINGALKNLNESGKLDEIVAKYIKLSLIHISHCRTGM